MFFRLSLALLKKRASKLHEQNPQGRYCDTCLVKKHLLDVEQFQGMLNEMGLDVIVQFLIGSKTWRAIDLCKG